MELNRFMLETTCVQVQSRNLPLSIMFSFLIVPAALSFQWFD